MKKKREDEFGAQEARERLEAALRGAREVGHKELKDISPKRPQSGPTNQKTKSGR
jgi:hypothetical protein